MYFSNLNAVEEKISCLKESSLLVLIGEETPEEEIKSLFHIFDLEGIRYSGGIFPGIIYNQNKYKEGYIIKKMDNVCFQNIFSMESNGISIPIIEKENLFALILLDGLSVHIKNFLGRIFACYTNSVKYIGGGAGSLSLNQKPCIFKNGEFFQDHALVMILEGDLDIRISHGWKKLEGPLVVTDSDKNLLKELNWQNAFDLYREIIFDYKKQELSRDNFFSLAKNYPFGIVTNKDHADERLIVRDPLYVTNENYIACVSDIPSNSMIYILTGDKNTLLSSTKKIKAYGNKPNRMVFDCISRTLILENEMNSELSFIHGGFDADVTGALTIGEIASTDKGYLEFLNKTIVYGEYI